MNKLFLIRYCKNCFVDGLRINWVGVINDELRFTLSGEEAEAYSVVEKDYQFKFLEDLQQINGNISDVRDLDLTDNKASK